ncbi:hypothetical protein [uncultured Alsobacter sp.]|uniref:hypothetical protein n=1 Tax=uncultured Alsobacter sp. TaxID=1748258 RepID=UPI0025E8CB0B|nr:hypothetical protein [uncultured Alsobacter sp.]
MIVRTALTALVVALALLGPPAPAGATDVRPIAFARGKSAATLSGAVVRGTRDVYSLEVKGGQTAAISVSATEKNAVFAIFQPGATVTADGDVNGEALPKAGEEDEARRWTGRLPATGIYLIVVGGTRGNATYSLTVQVR